MFQEQKEFGVLWGMKAYSILSTQRHSVQQIPALVHAEWLKKPNKKKHYLLQTQKGSVNQDSFDRPHVACCPFMGPEGKTQASLVFGGLPTGIRTSLLCAASFLKRFDKEIKKHFRK